MDLQGTAAELYGLAPGEFVAARTAAEKQARVAGDRELAGQIHALAKPTAPAWIANQLVRRHPDEIAALRELGAGLREATAGLDGEQLRQLSQQQNRVIAALVAQARSLAKAARQPMSESTERGLEATLRAALADEDLAEQVAAGQLTSALEHVGFAGTTFGAVPKPAPKAAPRDELKERRQRAERERAEAAVREARSAQRRASTVLDDAEAGLERADAAVAQTKAAAQQAESQHQEAKQARDQARKAATEASRQLEKAQTELSKLEQLPE